MAFLQNLESLKNHFDEILREVENLPAETRESCQNLLTESKNLLDKAQLSIEQSRQDVALVENAKKDILAKMGNIKLYSGLGDVKKDRIAETIINDNTKVLLDEDAFKKYIVSKLRNLDEESLVIKAYGKDGVLKIGSMLVDPGSSEQQIYDVGMKAALKSIASPMGREDALAHGQKRILSDMKLTHQSLMEYYQV